MSRIEQDLRGSFELQQVDSVDDVKEFEGVTNDEFNRHFGNELSVSLN